MIRYVDIPKELFDSNLSNFWNQLEHKLHSEYPNDIITSNYTGGEIVKSDEVLLLYEFRKYDSYKITKEKCSELGKPYNYFKKFYGVDRVE